MKRLNFALLGLIVLYSTNADADGIRNKVMYTVEHRYLNPILNLANKEAKNNITCLSLNIYHEARNSSTADKYGVANVTVNRTKHSKHPTDICGVVWKKDKYMTGQFSWTSKEPFKLYPKEKKSWDEVQLIAMNVYIKNFIVKEYPVLFSMYPFKKFISTLRPDNTKGATHYYQPKLTRKPEWAKHAFSKIFIGQHIYMRLSGS